LVNEWNDELSKVLVHTEKLCDNDRLERTVVKFKRNQEFAQV
jgi:hypothetical protein